jgi:hypothetical protein
MHAERSLADTSELEIPAELVAALKQSGVAQKRDFHVASWQPSLLGRVAQLFAPKRSGKARR